MFYGTLNVTLETGYTPEEGDEFVIISHTTGTGTFEYGTVTLLDLPDGLMMEIDYADPGVTLTVVESVGIISGTITCDSAHEVFVDLYTDDTTPPPADTAHTTCGGSYNFSFLPDGTYYVSAWIDLDDSGGGPPGEDETIIWYGNPTAVTITGGEIKENIDIVFPKESFMIFLPLIVR